MDPPFRRSPEPGDHRRRTQHQLEVGTAQRAVDPMGQSRKQIGIVDAAVKRRLEVVDHQPDVVNLSAERLAREPVPQFVPDADRKNHGEQTDPVPGAVRLRVEQFEDTTFSSYAKLNEERREILADVQQRRNVYGK